MDVAGRVGSEPRKLRQEADQAVAELFVGWAVGSVVGRYHYAADAVSGACLGLAGFLVSRFV